MNINGWQELVSNIASSAMWPIVVLILGLTFRDALRAAFRRVTGFEGLGAKLEFARDIEKLDSAAERIELANRESPGGTLELDTKSKDSGKSAQDPSNSEIFPPEEYHLWHRQEVYSTSPVERILYSWSDVERVIRVYWRVARDVKKTKLKNVRRESTNDLVRALWDADLLEVREVDFIDDLRMNRNRVAHENVGPTEGQGLAYEEAAKAIISVIQAKIDRLTRSQL